MKTYNIIRPVGLKPMPDRYEECIAEICARYFKSDVLFVLRGNHTTPDIKILATGEYWEIKNIRGGSKHTIEDNLRKASKQSQNVIISLLANTKMNSRQAEARIRYTIQTRRMPLKRVLFVTKSRQVIDIY